MFESIFNGAFQFAGTCIHDAAEAVRVANRDLHRAKDATATATERNADPAAETAREDTEPLAPIPDHPLCEISNNRTVFC